MRLRLNCTIKPVRKPKKLTLLGLFLLFIPLFSSCDSISLQNFSSQHASPYSILPQNRNATISSDFMQIKLLDSIQIKSIRINSLKVTELSDLAWDEDNQLLYAISDEGFLYHLRLTLEDDKIKDLEVLFATTLKDKSGRKLRGKYADSEGLTIIKGNNGIKGDSQLIISFEDKPRLAYYTPNGEIIGKVQIPRILKKKKYYRSKNKALESVTFHPKYGVLTASEYPLKKYRKNYQSIFSSTGKIWHFSASQATNSAITGMEVLPNGDVLVLERAYQNPIIPININLHRVKLNQCNKNNECKKQTIAHFDGADGWLLDNFEGITHFKGNKYFMVSDDNRNPLQKTILVLFEIKQAK